VYLPPFEAAIDAGAATVMTAFNEINGVPATGNKALLKDVLRGELGFDGLVVSDWDSVIEMIAHGYAADEKHAGELAAHAGLDMEMTSKAYENHLKDLIILPVSKNTKVALIGPMAHAPLDQMGTWTVKHIVERI